MAVFVLKLWHKHHIIAIFFLLSHTIPGQVDSAWIHNGSQITKYLDSVSSLYWDFLDRTIFLNTYYIQSLIYDGWCFLTEITGFRLFWLSKTSSIMMEGVLFSFNSGTRWCGFPYKLQKVFLDYIVNFYPKYHKFWSDFVAIRTTW